MELIPGYDNWKTSLPDEPEPEAYCDVCQKPLWGGDYITDICGNAICLDCLEDQDEEENMNHKEKITEILLATKREGMNALVKHMEEIGFFEAPCSTKHHLAQEGGLAEHSLNVFNEMACMSEALACRVSRSSIAICALLHDLGKAGQFGKPNYIENKLKSGMRSLNTPFKSNGELLYVDHEIRSVIIASQFIQLTEEEQQAILWHNGLYGPFKYEIQGKETPLYLLLHFADMWASRVIEAQTGGDAE